MSDRIDEIYADTTPLGKARAELFSIGSQDMPVGSDEVLQAMDAFERAVRQDEQRRLDVDYTKAPGAWAEIVNKDGSDEWLEVCSAALEEIHVEARRRREREVQSLNDEIQRLTEKVSDLEEDAARLTALEAFGVDNGDGYSDAMRALEDE